MEKLYWINDTRDAKTLLCEADVSTTAARREAEVAAYDLMSEDERSSGTMMWGDQQPRPRLMRH